MIVPASLVSNVWKEVAKHNMDIGPSDLKVISYQKATQDSEALSLVNWDITVVDEAHGARNTDTQKSKAVETILERSKKRLLLTGTPSYNTPEDLGVVLRMASGNPSIPIGKGFRDRYIQETKLHPGFIKSLFGAKPGVKYDLANTDELKRILSSTVDYHDARESSKDMFPSVERRIRKVEMGDHQKDIYKYLEGDIPFATRLKIRAGLPPSKQESKNLNAYLQGVRQASNSIVPYVREDKAANPEYRYSAKLRAAVNRVREEDSKDPNFKSVIYSNYLASGQDLAKELLDDAGISAEKFHGGLSKKQKDELVRRYNEGDVKTLLLSSSGSEGLDLKGTKLMQVLEPHFNKSKIDQVVARGDRYLSHAHLPESERKLMVEYYQSTIPQGRLSKLFGRKADKAVDEYLYSFSEEKDRLNQEIISLLREGQLHDK
jgi:SNF2 family DNA or RNA helicase